MEEISFKKYHPEISSIEKYHPALPLPPPSLDEIVMLRKDGCYSRSI